MNTPRKPTVPELLRKIERLEKQIEMLKKDSEVHMRNYSSYMCKWVDQDFRIARAIAFLKGEIE